MEDCPLRVCTSAAHFLTDFFLVEKTEFFLVMSIFCTEEVEGDVSGEGKHSHQKNWTPKIDQKPIAPLDGTPSSLGQLAFIWSAVYFRPAPNFGKGHTCEPIVTLVQNAAHGDAGATQRSQLIQIRKTLCM